MVHASAIEPEEEPEDEDAVPDDEPEELPDEEPEDEDAVPDDDPDELPDEEEVEPEDEPDEDDEPEDDPEDEDVEPEEDPEDASDSDPEEDPLPVPPPLDELEQPAAIAAGDALMPTTTITWKSFLVAFKTSPPVIGVPQQQHDQVMVHASALDPESEPDDEDAVPDDDPVLPEDEPVLPEDEDADPEEDPDVVGPELELLEQATDPTAAADAPMPTTTMT